MPASRREGYGEAMSLKQCQAVVLHGRDASGNRAGLQPPRRCRKAALMGEEWCEVHRGQAEVQALLRQVLRPGWEGTVERWERQRAREAREAELRRRLGA